jgi:hypothetical protein|tara:strand:- start:6589 stop:6777 length:189 start_codon:yes stop_codon:yes gene_type:complete
MEKKELKTFAEKIHIDVSNEIYKAVAKELDYSEIEGIDYGEAHDYIMKTIVTKIYNQYAINN